jgi:hypothetical protein
MDDTLKYVIHALDGNDANFITLPRKFVQGCVMKPEQFDEAVFQFQHEQGLRHTEAYEKAEDLHYKMFGSNRYSSYESFYNRKWFELSSHTRKQKI